MPTFRWQGVSPKGETLKGEMEATSREAVIVRLRTQRIQPVPSKIKEKGKGFDKDLKLPSFGAPVKSGDIVIFTRQFATMINAGLPILQCLQILGAQSESAVFRKVITELKDDIESGNTLADSCKKHPRVFTDLYSSLVQAGEIGGILDTILQRLSTYIEKIVKLRTAVRSALIYPTAVISIAGIVVWVILTWVIPVFSTLYEGLGVKLPLATRITIGLSRFLAHWSWLVAIGIGFAVFSLNRYYQTESGKRVIDRLMLKIPIIGSLLRKIAVARFCRTLGTLVSSGVPIL